jgi:hypothetical protein
MNNSNKNKPLQIRNSTAEFLIFTKQKRMENLFFSRHCGPDPQSPEERRNAA